MTLLRTLLYMFASWTGGLWVATAVYMLITTMSGAWIWVVASVVLAVSIAVCLRMECVKGRFVKKIGVTTGV